MAVIQPSTGGKAPVIDDDIYEVICLSVREVKLETPDMYGKTEKLEFKIELQGVKDDDGEPITLDPRCNKAWAENATLFKWAMAFGIDADPQRPIDTDLFHGKRARADIRTAEGKWPRVESFSPLPKRNSRATRAAEDDGPDFDGFWKKIRAAGFEQKDVALHLGGSLLELNDKSQEELDKIAAAMTG